MNDNNDIVYKKFDEKELYSDVERDEHYDFTELSNKQLWSRLKEHGFLLFIAELDKFIYEMQDPDKKERIKNMPQFIPAKFSHNIDKTTLIKFRDTAEKLYSIFSKIDLKKNLTNSELLHSVAEEMIFYEVLKLTLESLIDATTKSAKKVRNYFEVMQEGMFMDYDFQMLSMPIFDGIENDEEMKNSISACNLKPAEWFQPFSGFKRTIII
ncbi:MAG: hypothetical protein ABIH89_03895 [Elusimicrobiota bacterium]